ncbi:uncharacterized protein O3C94_013286 [Discoglossus pictus]
MKITAVFLILGLCSVFVAGGRSSRSGQEPRAGRKARQVQQCTTDPEAEKDEFLHNLNYIGMIVINRSKEAGCTVQSFVNSMNLNTYVDKSDLAQLIEDCQTNELHYLTCAELRELSYDLFMGARDPEVQTDCKNQ